MEFTWNIFFKATHIETKKRIIIEYLAFDYESMVRLLEMLDTHYPEGQYEMISMSVSTDFDIVPWNNNHEK